MYIREYDARVLLLDNVALLKNQAVRIIKIMAIYLCPRNIVQGVSNFFWSTKHSQSLSNV